MTDITEHTPTEREEQIARIVRMRDALLTNDKKTQKSIVSDHLAKMWEGQLTDLE